jgi:UPF0176 protein
MTPHMSHTHTHPHAERWVVAALYKFVALEDCADLRASLLETCESHGVCGTLLLAREGINGTIAGPRAGIDAVLSALRSDPRLADLPHKESYALSKPFGRMKVSLKREIVTMGVPEVDPTTTVGRYVKPRDWNALISSPDVVLIDTRNDYEVKIGTFEGAIDPNIRTFRAFPEWVRAQEDLAPTPEGKRPRVALFCTGGIRCEKATSLLKTYGFEDVYHLEGGILKYLEEVPAAESLWRGECFVFDERVAVGHGLSLGEVHLCHACRAPVTDEERADALFEEGVSCPRCYHERTPAQRASYAERHKQMRLAEARHAHHMGPAAALAAERAREGDHARARA